LKVRTMNAARLTLNAIAMATMLLAPAMSHALGLGRMVVQSALGEAMRAEIDITAMTPEEAATMKLRVAPAESYRAAGVEYNPVLATTQVSLQRRADGRSYLRLSSDRAVQEPFVDVILELNWANGRLVREYTLLFDPPSNRNTAAAPVAPVTAPVFTAPVPAPAPAAPTVAAVPASSPVAPAATKPAAVTANAPVAAKQNPKKAEPAAAPAATTVSEYKVRAGDTLTGVAQRYKQQGVSLDQMLVAIHRGNPDAFVDGNMNRLRSGAVLGLPGSDAARNTSPEQARQVILAQSADFQAYRERLAGGVATAKTEGPSNQAKGQVTAKVADKKPAASASPDRLTLAQGGVKASATAEAALSSAAEKKAQTDRLAELSRTVEELKKMKTPVAPAAASSPVARAAAPAAKNGIEIVAAPVPAAAATPAVVAQAPSAPARAAAPAPAASKPVVAPPVAASSATVKPAVAAPAAVAPMPIALDEPSFLDSPWVLPGAGVLAALLAAFGAYRLRGRLRKGNSETSFLESRLQPDSFFGASGGQRIDTREAGSAASAGSTASSMSYSLSQLDAIGDVDPVAEADVYLAYGRDLQAEEILKEAMRTTPDRLAVRTKLLEVYSKRRDTKGFELLATQLFGLTQGRGPDWERAQELGRQTEPDNPLYQPGGEPSLHDEEGRQMPEPLSASTQPHSVVSKPILEAPAALPVMSSLDMDLDLDIDPNEDHLAAFRTHPMPSPVEVAPGPAAHGMLEFDANALDLDLKAFDDDRSAKPPAIASLAATPQSSALDFDLSSISLDLGEPPVPPAERSVPLPLPSVDTQSGALLSVLPETPSQLPDDSGDPLLRKLELADEFRQIGDMEGARDLLEEVVAHAEGAMKTKAQAMLDNLA
jgi:pilus assembly protein FimV